MEEAQSSATNAAEVIDGEFTEISGGVPVPENLMDDADASPRYALPEELVKYSYESLPMVPVVGLPQSVALTERIVVTVTSTVDKKDWYDLGPYEKVASEWSPRYSSRIANLRQAKFCQKAAEENYTCLQRTKEQERINLNWKNSVYNDQIEAELKAAYEQWKSEREKLNTEIRETEDALILYKKERQADIEKARAQYWEVRDRAAKERDVRDKSERDVQGKHLSALADLEQENREARVKIAKQVEAERYEEQKASRERVHQLQADTLEVRKKRLEAAQQQAAEAEKAASTAEEAEQQVEIEVINIHGTKAETAWDKYQAMFDQAVQQYEEEERVLQAEAAQVTADLLSEKKEREDWLHQVEREAALEIQNLQASIHEVRKREGLAAARVYRSLDADETAPAAHIANLLTEDVVSEDTHSAHLAIPAQGKHSWKEGGKVFGEVMLHIALGGIFGISLGLLAGIIDLTPEGMRKTGGLIAALLVLGIFVFYMMGQLAYKATAYATEQFDEDRIAGRPRGRAWIAALFAFLVLFGMIMLEAYVERSGIVESLVQRQQEAGRESNLTATQEITYWMIALIVSAPFVISHAYDGAMKTRNRLGEKRRQVKVAECSYELATGSEAQAHDEARGERRAAEEYLKNHEKNRESFRVEAKRRIAEIEDLLRAHPAIVTWRNFVDSRDKRLNTDPLLENARVAWDQAQKAWEHDPALTAARDRSRAARVAATEARRKAEEACAQMTQTWSHAAHEIVASAGTSIAQAVGEKGGDAVFTVMNAATHAAAIGSPVTTVSQIASDLFDKNILLPASSTQVVATWEETLAKERWDSLRSAISQDVQVRFYQSRIASLRRSIHSLDTRYGKRRQQLLGQKRAIEVRLVEVEDSNRASSVRNALFEADQDLKAAKLACQEEIDLLLRLIETPGFLQWAEVLRQRLFVRTMTQRQLAAARKPALLAAKVSESRA